MNKLFENWRKHLEEAVPHSAQHVVKKMKKTGKSAKETLKSLTTDLSDEEAERWLERHKDEMESAKQDLDEAAYEPGRAVADIGASMDPEDDMGGRFDSMFDRGQPGNDFAEAVARELMLDEESHFEELIQAIKDGLDSWYESMKRGQG